MEEIVAVESLSEFEDEMLLQPARQ